MLETLSCKNSKPQAHFLRVFFLCVFFFFWWWWCGFFFCVEGGVCMSDVNWGEVCHLKNISFPCDSHMFYHLQLSHNSWIFCWTECQALLSWLFSLENFYWYSLKLKLFPQSCLHFHFCCCFLFLTCIFLKDFISASCMLSTLFSRTLNIW